MICRSLEMLRCALIVLLHDYDSFSLIHYVLHVIAHDVAN